MQEWERRRRCSRSVLAAVPRLPPSNYTNGSLGWLEPNISSHQTEWSLMTQSASREGRRPEHVLVGAIALSVLCSAPLLVESARLHQPPLPNGGGLAADALSPTLTVQTLSRLGSL